MNPLPLLTRGAWDEPVLEWWSSGPRKLTIHIGPTDITYVKVWGPDIEHEMEEGRMSDTTIGELWAWLWLTE